MEMAIRFHEPFNPIGFSTFWKEVSQSVQKAKCSEEIECFLKTVKLDPEVFNYNKEKTSKYMAQLYIRYIE